MPKKPSKNPINKTPEPEFYGTAVVGTKGQIVIPSSAREKYNIKPQDKLVIFGAEGGVLAIIKAEQIQQLLSDLGSIFRENK